MFKNYFKTAFRNFWANKTYSFLNVIGLSIGITCAALIFLWVEDEMNFDSHQEKKDRIYLVYEHQTYEGKTVSFPVTPGPFGPAVKQEIPGIKESCRTSWPTNSLFTLGDKRIYEKGLMVEPAFLSIFTIPLRQGNASMALNKPGDLVISEKMAMKFFGKTDVLGKTLRINNRNEHVISAVFKNNPTNSSVQFEWLIPFKNYLDENDWLQAWGNNGIKTYVELEPSADLTRINRQLYSYIQTKDTAAVAKTFLFPMKDWRLRNNFVDGHQTGGRIVYVRLFSTIAWIILLIACINFMNLATARSEKRAREVGVRKVLGAGKKMLVFQFLGEAMFMSILAVLFSIGFILLALPGFNILVRKELSAGLEQPSHYLVLLSIGLICGLVAGSYPSLYLSSFNPIVVLKGWKSRAGLPALIRKGLVVLQFTISIVLIVCTIVVYEQIAHIKSRELGYDRNNLVQINARPPIKKNFDAIRQDLVNSGYVAEAGLSNLNILEMGSQSDSYTWPGHLPSQKILITEDAINANYLGAAGNQLVAGRNFSDEGMKDSLSVIVNQTLAKMISADGNVVGKLLTKDSTQLEIVGVVKDFVFGNVYGKTDPMLFYYQPNYANYLYVRMKPGQDVEKGLARIENVMRTYNPEYPFEYRFVDDQFNDLFQSETLIGKLSRIFAILAIFISCLGLFGLAAFTAEQKTREIGIRKVLGATVEGLATWLSADFMRLVVLSVVLAFPLAWWMMHKWLEDFEYRVQINWMIFVAAGIIAFLIALFTVSFQTIKAALSNPIKSLRRE